MKRVLTTKIGLWIDKRSSTDNRLHGSGMAVEKRLFYFELSKQLKSVMVILHAMCSVLKM